MYGNFESVRQPARASDPQSSWNAARTLRESGSLTNQALDTLRALMRRGEPVTSAELAGPDVKLRYQYARRLPDLLRHNPPLVIRGPKRECVVTGFHGLVWSVSDAGRELLGQVNK